MQCVEFTNEDNVSLCRLTQTRCCVRKQHYQTATQTTNTVETIKGRQRQRLFCLLGERGITDKHSPSHTNTHNNSRRHQLGGDKQRMCEMLQTPEQLQQSNASMKRCFYCNTMNGEYFLNFLIWMLTQSSMQFLRDSPRVLSVVELFSQSLAPSPHNRYWLHRNWLANWWRRANRLKIPFEMNVMEHTKACGYC